MRDSLLPGGPRSARRPLLSGRTANDNRILLHGLQQMRGDVHVRAYSAVWLTFLAPFGENCSCGARLS
jgi:hypothetical protein